MAVVASRLDVVIFIADMMRAGYCITLRLHICRMLFANANGEMSFLLPICDGVLGKLWHSHLHSDLHGSIHLYIHLNTPSTQVPFSLIPLLTYHHFHTQPHASVMVKGSNPHRSHAGTGVLTSSLSRCDCVMKLFTRVEFSVPHLCGYKHCAMWSMSGQC